MRWRWMAWCVASLVALGGCGGGATGTNSLPPQLASDLSAFEDAYAHAWCDGLAACCHFWPFHQDVCMTSARQLAADDLALAYFPGSPLPHLDANARDTCLAEVKAVVASCPATTFATSPTPDCGLVFTTGTSPQGGPCGTAADCASPPGQGPTCDNEICGVPLANVASGGFCSDTGQCASGLACNSGPYGGNGTCGPKIAVGGRCELDADCVDNTWCHNACTAFTPVGTNCEYVVECGPTASCATGVCQALGGTGSPCTDSSGCLPTNYCSPDTSACTTRIAIGGACPAAAASQYEQPCADDGFCSHTSGTLLLSGDTTPLVCVPMNLPILCYTG